jgi:hypothetical protein
MMRFLMSPSILLRFRPRIFLALLSLLAFSLCFLLLLAINRVGGDMREEPLGTLGRWIWFGAEANT